MLKKISMITTISTQIAQGRRSLDLLVGVACLLLFSKPVLCADALRPLPYAGVTHTSVAGDPDPVFSSGAVLKVKANRSPTPEIQVIDVNNNLVSTVSVNIPEARSVIVYSFAHGADGDLAVSGCSFAEDGRFAEFIDLMGSHEAGAKIIRTDPFVPRSIALAADGTVWATGNVYHSKTAPLDVDPAHSVLRHFDRQGHLLPSFFPAAEIHDQVRLMQGQVATASDRVGWISNGNYKAESGRPGSYIEIDSTGKSEEYPLPPVASEPGARVVSLALTAKGSAFATAIEQAGSLQVFKLDRGSRTWTSISIPSFAGTPPFLLGASGESLAFWDSNEAQIRFFDAAQK